MNRRRFLATFGALCAAAACDRAAPLTNTHDSAESLAAAVLDGLAMGDRGRLEALALSEREFRDHVWPELPAARPERNLPFAFVWGDLRQKSQAELSSTLSAHTGRRYTLEKVTFADQTAYESYRVRRDATFHVRDAAGTGMALRVCGSMFEKDGEWKVFSYVVD